MLTPNQIVEVKMSGRTINHYRKLGYDVNNVGEMIRVPVEHLTSGSHVEVKVRCDICGEIFERPYKEYLKYHTYNMDLCKKCSIEKSKLTCVEKYGVDNVAKTPETKEKMKKTCLERFGVENYSSTDECREKVRQTCLKKIGVENFLSSPKVREQIKNTVQKKYGVDYIGELDFVRQKIKDTIVNKYGVEYSLQIPEIREKIKRTCLDKYGVENPFLSKDVQEKIKNINIERYGVENPFASEQIKDKIKRTNVNKYGVENPMQLEEIKNKAKETCVKRYNVENPMQSFIIREKANNTLLKNNQVPTSKQQLEVYNILSSKNYDVKLNEPFNSFLLDVALYYGDKKIDIEYDGWYWHQDKQKDRRRDEVLKLNGWKILRIKSGRNIPKTEDLLNAIEQLVGTDRTYKEIRLDDWKEGESA